MKDVTLRVLRQIAEEYSMGADAKDTLALLDYIEECRAELDRASHGLAIAHFSTEYVDKVLRRGKYREEKP